MNEEYGQQDVRSLVTLQERAQGRLAPFAHTLVAAGSGSLLLAVPEQKAILIRRLIVCNHSTSAGIIDLFAIPSGGAAGTSNQELSNYDVASHSTVDVTALVSGLYQAGTALQLVANTSNIMTVSGYYEEIF